MKSEAISINTCAAQKSLDQHSSAIFAALLGLVLLPFSIIGLGLGSLIGILGFSPLATAFVFFRNAVRAYRKAIENESQARVRVFFVFGLMTTCTVPWVAQWYVAHELSRAMEMAQSADPSETAHGIVVLKRFRVFASFDETSFDKLVFVCEAEQDQKRRERLAAW